MDKFKLKSQSKNTTKVGFQLDYVWANVLGNEYKFGVTKAYWLDFHEPIYLAFKLPNTFPMYNKNPLSSPFFQNVAYECYIFDLINDTQNGDTLWPKFIYFLLVFMDHVQTKNHNYQPHYEFLFYFIIHMYIYQVQ
jgi:hypothetical protein